MIYMRNITITTAKSATYLENVGSCSHYIIEAGPYARAFAELAAQPDFSALYVELWDDADARKKRKAKSASKTRYTCPNCELHAWAKPGARLVCGECDEPMAAEDGDDG